MNWIDYELLGPLLRVLVYVATIATAGAVLFRLTFPQSSEVIRRTLRWQIIIGGTLLLLVEPLRYVIFQLEVAGGDPALAFSDGFRQIYVETPQGIAALTRIVGTLIIFGFGLRFRLLAATGAILAVGSYMMEGHSISHEPWLVLCILIGSHLLVLHWWIGSLPALYMLTRRADRLDIHRIVKRFGQIATALVPVMLIAGVAALGFLVDWTFKPNSDYQQRMGLKILAVTGVLAAAAANKVWLTPALASSPHKGQRSLRTSLRIEMMLVLAIVSATSWMITTAPGVDH